MLQRGMRVIVLIVLSIGLALTFVGGTVAAASRRHEQPAACRPGWGFGDKNHCHTGPPGLNNGYGLIERPAREGREEKAERRRAEQRRAEKSRSHPRSAASRDRRSPPSHSKPGRSRSTSSLWGRSSR